MRSGQSIQLPLKGVGIAVCIGEHMGNRQHIGKVGRPGVRPVRVQIVQHGVVNTIW